MEMLREGCTHRACYGAAHISAETFYSWLRSKPAFLEEVRAAEAEAERRWLLAAMAQAKAADWTRLLGLRFRDDWGERLTIAHDIGVKVEYINDWRGAAANAAPGPADSQD